MTTATAPALFDLAPPLPTHPATYTDALLVEMARFLKGRTHILDPFGGQGGIFALEHWLPDAKFEAVELEPEFAAKHPKTRVGSALALPWGDNAFDAICTSPTYGNRMADKLIDGYDRITYSAKLGHALHPDNSGAMQWGNKYRDFHVRAWTEARRVLQPGGAFVLNIKDHIRAGQVQEVTRWHIETLYSLGFAMLDHRQIETPSMRYGRNSELRVPYESVIAFQLKGTQP